MTSKAKQSGGGDTTEAIQLSPQELRSRASPFISRAESEANLDKILTKCKGRVVFLSGLGGGCDMEGSALLLERLRKVARKVAIANLSFSSFSDLNAVGKVILKHPKSDSHLCYLVPPGVPVTTQGYFPEALYATAVNQGIYTFKGQYQTVKQIADVHRAILANEGVRAEKIAEEVCFIGIDGGFDSALSGREIGLATPAEDFLHLRAIEEVGYAPHLSYIMCCGLDVDCAHGLTLSDVEARLQELKEDGALLYGIPLSKHDENPDNVSAAKFYCDAVAKCKPVNTIVQSLCSAAIDGHRKWHTPPHLVPRIKKTRVPLSDFTASMYILSLPISYSDCEYVKNVVPSDGIDQLCAKLEAYRATIPIPLRRSDPIYKERYAAKKKVTSSSSSSSSSSASASATSAACGGGMEKRESSDSFKAVPLTEQKKEDSEVSL